MKKISKTVLTAVCTIALMFGASLSSDAAVCNSPCPDPCAPSHTVCQGTSCTTTCGATSIYNTAYYTTPGVAFSYSTPNVSFSISNEVYGIYNYYSRPNFTVTSGFRPIYRPAPKPVHHVVYKNPPKPAPALNKKPAPAVHKAPAQNIKPAPRPNMARPAQKPMPAANKKPKK